jgi:hypothetical protein
MALRNSTIQKTKVVGVENEGVVKIWVGCNSINAKVSGN